MSRLTKIKYLQAIFSWRIMKEIENNRLIINIDESRYSRSITDIYFWLSKGKRRAIINSTWISCANLILILWSSRDWIEILSSITVKSNYFWRFLVIMKSFIALCLNHDQDNLILSLKINAPIHLVTKIRRVAYLIRLRVMWLPLYSPTLAPIKRAFELSKKILTKKENWYKFCEKLCKMMIVCTLRKINQKQGIKILRKSHLEGKECIMQVKAQIKTNEWLRNLINEGL